MNGWVTGVVANWNHKGGFGFIDLEDGRHAYVHCSAFGGGDLVPGLEVSARVLPDAQNPEKWAAKALWVPGASREPKVQPAHPPVAAGWHASVWQSPTPRATSATDWGTSDWQSSLLTGVVLEWNRKGFGFIGLADGKRAYVHISNIRGGSELKDIPLQAKVRCRVDPDQQNPGKLAAFDVELLSGVSGLRCWVKEWNERGYGFVECEDGRRAYIHHSIFGSGNLQIGQELRAVLREDAANRGKWAVASCELGSAAESSWPEPTQPAWPALALPEPAPLRVGGSSGSISPLPGKQSQLWANGNGKLVPLSATSRQIGNGRPRSVSEPWMVESTVPEALVPAFDERRRQGEIVEWNSRGFGFMQCEDGRRAYVHVSFFGGGELLQGEIVNAVISEDSSNPGKWCARELVRGPLNEDGVLEEWSREQGYGFLRMQDGRRCYIHHSIFGGGNLQVGLPLVVRTKPDDRNPGKWCVAQVITDLTGVKEEREVLLPATVYEWESRGFGFVELEDGRRAYVHHSAFGSGDLMFGEKVSVSVVADQRNPGKWSVKSLVRQSASPDMQETVAQTQTQNLNDLMGNDGDEQAEQAYVIGTVVQWHEDRGYGFVDLEDGRKVYVHHTFFGGGSLMEGQPCELLPAPDRKNPGKWSATHVRGAAVIKRALGATLEAIKDVGDEAVVKRQRLSADGDL